MRKVREITLDNTKRLLKDLGNGILGRHEFKREYNNIADNVETILITSTITRNQEKNGRIYVAVEINFRT